MSNGDDKAKVDLLFVFFFLYLLWLNNLLLILIYYLYSQFSIIVLYYISCIMSTGDDKAKVDLGLLEEDDEFEEFPAEGKLWEHYRLWGV